MGAVFERFTERARQVVVLSQEEARGLTHNYIGTEHLLLGLLREEEGLAAHALSDLGVELEPTRSAVARIVGSGEAIVSGQIPFTPRAKKVLEFSLREAQSLGHNYIGTEHLLLGLAREQEGVAARVLLEMGIDSERLRNQVLAVLAEAPPSRASGPRQDEHAGELPEARLAVLDGLLAAWERRSDIFELVAEAPDRVAARKQVAELLHASEGMADRVLNLHLADMTQADGARMREQRDELRRRLDAGDA